MSAGQDTAGAELKDNWGAGELYEPYVGRWSRLVARNFLDWLAVPAERSWLDVGCGTGALTETILAVANPRAVKGIDASEGFISYARGKITHPHASFQIGDAQSIPVESAAYDAVVSGFVLNFVPDTSRAVTEMRRTVRPGGLVAAYVWDYADKMQFMRHFWNAAAALDPLAAQLDEGKRFPLCNPDALHELFRSAGLDQVEVQPIDIWTVFKNFDDYWLPFLGGQGSAPSYNMSLNEQLRTELRERIREALPYAVDGSIPLVARAWAVRAVR